MSAGEQASAAKVERDPGPGMEAFNAFPLTAGRKYRYVLPTIALLLYLAQCAWFIGTQSLTVDEPTHILAGLEAWRFKRFERWNDHPPLARLICTLPAINRKYQIDREPYQKVNEILPSPSALAWHTRPMNSIMGLLLGLLVWLAARRAYSEAAANFAILLYAFSPAMIAHFSLVGNDGIAALATFATAFQVVRWRRDPSLWQTVLLGLAAGGLLLAKFSVLPLVALTLGLILVLKRRGVALRPTEWNWMQSLAVGVMALGVLWAGYFFHVSKVSVTIRQSRVEIQSPNYSEPKVTEIDRPLHARFPVPAGEFLQAVLFQAQHLRGAMGVHSAYLFGRIYDYGTPLFFPAVILLKWPTIVLVCCLLSTVMLALRRSPLPPDFWIWAAFSGVFLLFAISSTVQIGERLILPLYPFGLLLAAGVWRLVQSRRALALILLAIVVHAVDATRYAPDYLPYFNLFVRTQTWHLLSDSNVDWGNGLNAVREYQLQHANETIYMAYFGSVDPAVYGVKAILLKEEDRVTGTVIISANYLAGQNLKKQDSFRWLLNYPRKTVLADGLYVFDVH